MTLTRSFARCRFRTSVLLAGLVALLSACGGGGEDSAPPPPPPIGNRAPVGAIVSATATAAGEPLVLDASSSSDADADPLSYRWSFGDGTQGGGSRIAHIYASGGSYTVRLTVDDGQGGVNTVERSVNVSAPPAPAALVPTLTIVRSNSGALLPGVIVVPVSGAGTGTTTATTDAQGRATLTTGTGVATLLKFSKDGYAEQFRSATLPAEADSGYVEVTLLPRQAAQTLADAAAGGTLTGKDGATVTFPPGALVDAAGAAVSGPVQVYMTPVDVGANVAAFPGRFAGVRPDGQQGLLLSYGTVEYVLRAAGAPVQLAAGQRATIEIPVYTSLHRDGTPVQAGDTSPLWSLDERTGAWIEEGLGTVVAANTPSGFALRAPVQHFSWWNHDEFEFPPAQPKPKCMVDTNADGVLEDLTGTGHCWHAGTGPEQPTRAAVASQRARPLGARRLADDMSTTRVPAWAAYESTPAAGGVALPIPGDMDITFRSSAKNGTLFGTTVVNLPRGAEQDVTFVLRPVKTNPGTLAVTLPFDDSFRTDVVGQTDRLTFEAEAGASYQISVAPVASSTLAGAVQVIDPAQVQLNGGNFATGAEFTGTASSATAGTMTVVIRATANTPGAYRVRITRLTSSGGCASPQVIALPQVVPTFSVPRDGAIVCFNLPLAAADVLEIRSTRNLNAQGRLSLISPSGQTAGSDSYGTDVQDGLLLRAAIAEPGTWRLEINNTRSSDGSIEGLSTTRLPVESTLGNNDSVSFTGPAGAVNARYHLVQATTPNGELVVTLDGKFTTQTVRAFPEAASFGDGTLSARIMSTGPGLYPLLGVQRGAGATSWDYTLSTSLPLDLTLDSQLSRPISPGGLYVYRLPSGLAPQLTLAWAATGSANPNITLYGPATGARIAPPIAGLLYTLSEIGTYTVLVRANTTEDSTLTWRLNTVAEAEAVPAGPFERSGTLEMGQLRRYAVPLQAQQLISLGLSTPGTYDVSTQMKGIGVDGAAVSFSGGSGPGPRSGSSRASFVQATGTGELWVWNSGRPEAGSYSVSLQSPTPTAATLGALLDLAPSLDQLKTWRFDLATEGMHLLCTRHDGHTNLANALDPKVWGPSAQFAGYTSGDINGATPGAEVETLGVLRAGINSLSVMPGSATVTTAQARLVALAPATPISTGAAATGSLTACQRAYHSFDAVAGTTYSVRVTAGFNGTLRVRKVVPNGDVTSRVDPPFNTGNVGATPVPLAADAERIVSFTIAAGQGGNHVIEVDGDGDAAGNYTVQLSTP